jgi:integrase
MAGEGSIFKRADGMWVAALSLGGRQDRRKIKRVRETRREAAAALDQLKADRLQGIDPSRLALGSYLRSWLTETVLPVVTPNTARSYRASVEHWQPIAHLPLADVRAADIERVTNRMTATHYLGARGYVEAGPAGPKTIRNAQVVLRAALEQATVRGYVRRNEAKLVKLREVRRPRRPAMTPELARRILAAIAGDRYEAGYALAMAALRESEVLGLTRDDVDLDAGRITIRHQLRDSGTKARLAPTKTPGSSATIDLPAFVTERLAAHIERHDPVALVFTTKRGLAVNGTVFTKHFQALLERAGLPRMTIHDLRAGAASLLAAQGAHPSLARDFLRHASVTTTLTHYTRTTDAQRAETARLLDAAVRSEP